MSATVLEVDSAARRFGAREVLHAASLWAHEGQVTSLLGRNGCGKTTLLRIATGLLTAHAGTVRYQGRYFARPRLSKLARLGLAFLPAREYLPHERTLRDIFALCAWPMPVSESVIAEFGLAELLGQRPLELSGGELRRAEIASVMLRRPACLLLDEPFRGIAPKDCERLTGIIRGFAAQGGAVVVTGHEAAFMLGVADDVIWCHDGTTEGIGAPDDARQHFRFRQAYLGPSS